MIPVVAVVIPNLNGARYLGQAVESARRQTAPVRTIVVDGGSTDRSRAAAAGACWIGAAGSGIARARNLGVAAAWECEFIVQLDADDWMDPTCVERCLTVMKSACVGVVATGMVVHVEVRGEDWREACWPDEPITVARLAEANRLFPASLYRRVVWEQVGGYDEHPRTYEDWDFWLRVAEAGWEFGVVREMLYHHRLLDDSSTGRMVLGDHEAYVARVQSRRGQRMSGAVA